MKVPQAGNCQILDTARCWARINPGGPRILELCPLQAAEKWGEEPIPGPLKITKLRAVSCQIPGQAKSREPVVKTQIQALPKKKITFGHCGLKHGGVRSARRDTTAGWDNSPGLMTWHEAAPLNQSACQPCRRRHIDGKLQQVH